MALNRFDQHISYRSQFIPKEFIADFEGLKQSAALQQQQYDQIQEASNKLPKHIQGDTDAVNKYRLENEQRMEEVTNQYRQGIDVGNRARRDYLTDIKRDWSPTGRAFNIQSNYDAYGAYKKDLDDRLATDKINNEFYNAAMNRSTEGFSSYDEDFKNFKQFDGYKLGNYVDVEQDMIDILGNVDKDLAQGKFIGPNGRTVGKTHNGQYFYTDTDEIEYITKGKIQGIIDDMVYADPSRKAFLDQQDDLFKEKYTDAKGKEYTRSQKQIQELKAGLGSTFSVMRQKTNRDTVIDWGLKQDREWGREDEQAKSLVQSFDLPPTASGLQQAKINPEFADPSKFFGSINKEPTFHLPGVSVSSPVYKEKLAAYKKEHAAWKATRVQFGKDGIGSANLKQFLATTEGKDLYSNGVEMYELARNAANSTADNEGLVSDKVIFKKFVDFTNQYADKVNITSGDYKVYDAKTQKDKSYLYAQSGNLDLMAVTPTGPNQDNSTPLTLSDVLKTTGVSREELMEDPTKHIKVHGRVGKSVHGSNGELVSVQTTKGPTYMITSSSKEQAAYMSSHNSAIIGKYDPLKAENPELKALGKKYKGYATNTLNMPRTNPETGAQEMKEVIYYFPTTVEDGKIRVGGEVRLVERDAQGNITSTEAKVPGVSPSTHYEEVFLMSPAGKEVQNKIKDGRK
jgi:hypothetical protein